jgi:copper(I)-binding protein
MSPVLRNEAVVYLKITNEGGKDELTGIKTDIPGAAADFHRMKGSFMVLSKSLAVPAKSVVELMPMDAHIMIGNMPKDFGEGRRFVLTLVFERSGSIDIPLTLQRAQPMMDEHGHHMH